MNGDFCIYIMYQTGSIERIVDFLSWSLSRFEPDFDILDYVDTDGAGDTLDSSLSTLFHHISKHRDRQHQLYFSSSAPRGVTFGYQAMLLFPPHEPHIIVGLAAIVEDAMLTLKLMSRFLPSSWGVVTGEDLPPTTFNEFQEYCCSATSPRLINGQYIE